jgi:proteic killer suppression protein
MIHSFRCAETAKMARGDVSRRFPASLQPVMRRKLRLLEIAAALEDLRVPPGNRLEALKGSRKGQHSIRVNDQYRLCFHWLHGAAQEVEIVDYH